MTLLQKITQISETVGRKFRGEDYVFVFFSICAIWGNDGASCILNIHLAFCGCVGSQIWVALQPYRHVENSFVSTRQSYCPAEFYYN